MVTHKDIQKTFFFLLHLPKPRNKKEATKEQSNLPSYFLDVIIITQKKAFKCLYLYLGNQGKSHIDCFITGSFNLFSFNSPDLPCIGPHEETISRNLSSIS